MKVSPLIGILFLILAFGLGLVNRQHLLQQQKPQPKHQQRRQPVLQQCLVPLS